MIGSREGALRIDLERVICRFEDLEPHGARAFTIGGGDWPLQGLRRALRSEVAAT